VGAYNKPRVGEWRSLVAHLNGVQGAAGSNPVSPIYNTARGAGKPRVLEVDGHHLAQSFKETIVKLGLRPIVFHELRAIFVTRNLDAGVPSNQVADMIGDTPAMVETYRRRRVEGQRAAHKAVWG
jgi:integrase